MIAPTTLVSVPAKSLQAERINPFPTQQSSAYGADIITPHLPQAASSPQAPQGEDNRVRCKIQQRTNVARGTHGFARSLDTVLPQKPYRYNVNAPLKCLPLAELEGKVSPLVTDEVLLNLRC